MLTESQWQWIILAACMLPAIAVGRPAYGLALVLIVVLVGWPLVKLFHFVAAMRAVWRDD